MSTSTQDLNNNNFFWGTILVILLFLVMWLQGCTTPTKIVREVHTDTLSVSVHDTLKLYEYKNVVDTFIQSHIVYVTLDSTGKETKRAEYHDTYRSSVSKDSTSYYKALYDSLKSVKKDSIPVVVEVEKKLTKYERFKIDNFWYTYIILGLLLFLLLLFARRK